MREQAEKFGAIVDYGEVTEIRDLGDRVSMRVDGDYLEARTVLLAVGNSYRKLGLSREDEFIGRGIHFCATCDGAFYAGKEVITVGGGNAAVQEALFLSRFASKVKMLVRTDIKAQDILQKRLQKAVNEGKIEIFLGTEIEELLIEELNLGDKIIGVKVRQRLDGNTREFNISAAAIFEFIGLDPQTKFLEGSGIELNQRGEIVVDDKFSTSLKNIFASGDAIENAERQLVIAAASGAKAAIEISKILHRD